MTKININGDNHQVEVDHSSEDLGYVIEKAQKLWEQTKPTDTGPGPAYGFLAQVKNPQNGSEYGRAGFNYNEQPVVDR